MLNTCINIQLLICNEFINLLMNASVIIWVAFGAIQDWITGEIVWNDIQSSISVAKLLFPCSCGLERITDVFSLHSTKSGKMQKGFLFFLFSFTCLHNGLLLCNVLALRTDFILRRMTNAGPTYFVWYLNKQRQSTLQSHATIVWTSIYFLLLKF